MLNYEVKEYIPLLISDIKRALDNGLYFVALAGALTIPDILSKAESGFSGRNEYANWVDKYVFDEFGRSYGERLKAIENTYNAYGRSYSKSPTIMCGQNCYQLRCSLLHDGTNEIKGNSKSGKCGKNLWIDECVLELTEEESSRGVRNRSDVKLEKSDDGKIEWKQKNFSYINVRELCNDIIRSAKEYISNESIHNKLPKINVSNGGGRINPLMGADAFNKYYQLVREAFNRN